MYHIHNQNLSALVSQYTMLSVSEFKNYFVSVTMKSFSIDHVLHLLTNIRVLPNSYVLLPVVESDVRNVIFSRKKTNFFHKYNLSSNNIKEISIILARPLTHVFNTCHRMSLRLKRPERFLCKL